VIVSNVCKLARQPFDICGLIRRSGRCDLLGMLSSFFELSIRRLCFSQSSAESSFCFCEIILRSFEVNFQGGDLFLEDFDLGLL
jgi:hypothetical protein